MGQQHPAPQSDCKESSVALFGGGPLDMLLCLLALVSLVLLVRLNFFHTTPSERTLIRVVDFSVCGIFAGEFFWRWAQEGWAVRRYLGRNWYALLGMIPVSHHAMLHHPIWRMVLILARFGRAIDRMVGEGFTYRLVNRIKDPVVGAVSGVVTIAMLDRVGDVLAKGHYSSNIARALAANESDVRRMVLEKLRNDPQLGKLSRLPYSDVIAEASIDALMRVIEEFLKDPRTDALIADILRENLQQLREAVAEQEADKGALFGLLSSQPSHSEPSRPPDAN